MKRAELEQRQYVAGSILLGRDNDGNFIGAINDDGRPDDRHIVTVAGSRAGKSSTCLKPNLALWPSSVLCIDPKGELATETAVKRAQMGQDVYILDPFNEVKGDARKYLASYDPLDEIKAGKEEDIIDNSAMLADAMIVPDKDAKSDHWSTSAKNLVRGFILWALHRDLNHDQTVSINDIREALLAPQESEDDEEGDEIGMDTLFKMMGDTEAFSGVLAGIGNSMAGKPTNEKGSIISTAIEQTAFLDSEPMQTHFEGEDLRPLPSLRILKQRPTTIYLVLPASRMGTHFRWLRMILTLALSALENEPHQLGKDGHVLFILEEFPQLGYLRQIESAAGLMAGYNVKLWTVLQDLSQLKSQYRDSWETFIGNAGVFQAFGNTDATTTEYISRSLGNLQIAETTPTYATASNVGGGGLTERENSKGVPLLAPFEIAQYCARETGMQIIRFAGKPPAYIHRMTHEEVSKIGN